jgi:alpha-glucosidase
MLSLHRRLLALRRSSDDLAEGAYETLHAGSAVLAYRRGERTAVALNLGAESESLVLEGEIVLSTGLDGRDGERVRGELRLGAGEGAIVRLPGR